MSSESLHEPVELVSERTRNLHRAIVSLIEELEAIDWYQQRADGCSDDALREILLHNKSEEIEHAVMTLEWIRRQDARFDQELRAVLFTEGSIAEREGTSTPDTGVASVPGGSLGLGSLRSGS